VNEPGPTLWLYFVEFLEAFARIAEKSSQLPFISEIDKEHQEELTIE